MNKTSRQRYDQMYKFGAVHYHYTIVKARSPISSLSESFSNMLEDDGLVWNRLVRLKRIIHSISSV